MSVNPPIPPKPFYSTAICLQKSQLNIGKVELQTRSFLLFLNTYLKRVIITLFPSHVVNAQLINLRGDEGLRPALLSVLLHWSCGLQLSTWNSKMHFTLDYDLKHRKGRLKYSKNGRIVVAVGLLLPLHQHLMIHGNKTRFMLFDSRSRDHFSCQMSSRTLKTCSQAMHWCLRPYIHGHRPFEPLPVPRPEVAAFSALNSRLLQHFEPLKLLNKNVHAIMQACFHFLINDQLAPLLRDCMSPSDFITVSTSKLTKQGTVARRGRTALLLQPHSWLLSCLPALAFG